MRPCRAGDGRVAPRHDGCRPVLRRLFFGQRAHRDHQRQRRQGDGEDATGSLCLQRRKVGGRAEERRRRRRRHQGRAGQGPDEPEDKDGFEDEDGCPELDNDKDGIYDSQDKCPNDPEDKDGFEDTDGCPDPDNDKDGVLDKDDKCPMQPGPKENQGCPDTDKDKDTVVDRLDKCPDDPGPPSNAGCPEKKYITITQEKIELKRQVQFATAKAIINKDSFRAAG